MNFWFLFVLSFSILSCQHKSIEMKTNTYFSLENSPLLEEDPTQKIHLGGFSALHFIPTSDPLNPEFFAVTDRGPNGESFRYSVMTGGKSVRFMARTFLAPKYNPKILRLKIKDHQIHVLQEIPLLNPNGTQMSGLPNREETQDELPLDSNNQKLQYDLNGIDSESLTVDSQGNFWIGEEYRPSLLKFNPKGQLLKRFSPANSFTQAELKKIHQQLGSEILEMNLPEIYNQRMLNRGFEALTRYQNKLYAMLQSSLALNDKLVSDSRIVRILEFDLESEKVTGEFVYLLNNEKNKIGDMTVSKNGILYILEQNGVLGSNGFRSIFSVHLKTATNIHNKNYTKEPESMAESEFLKNISPVHKELTLDLAKVGFNDSEKLEGLALIDENTFAIINDQDFSVVNGEVSEKVKTKIGIFKF